jgi:O-succinylbenzoic acid--CoA ligase
MSETCGGCVYDGRPLDDVEASIGADGRIRLAGPTLFSGYRLHPELTAAALVDGRFITEDLGRLTGDSRLEVLGRADDVVITGGVNVPAGLVSRVIGDHPQVRACLVVGVPDREWGQRLVAVIEPLDPNAPPSLEAIRSFASSQLEPAAVPTELVAVAALPMLASGKPDRAKIARIAAAHCQPQER